MVIAKFFINKNRWWLNCEEKNIFGIENHKIQNARPTDEALFFICVYTFFVAVC